MEVIELSVVLEKQNGTISVHRAHWKYIICLHQNQSLYIFECQYISWFWGCWSSSPFDPDGVLAKLHMKTPTPPSSSSNQSFLFRNNTSQSLSPSEAETTYSWPLNQVLFHGVVAEQMLENIKGVEMAMQNFALLRHQVHQLYMPKKRKPRAFIQDGAHSYSFAEVVYSDVFHDGAVGITWRGLTLDTKWRRNNKVMLSEQEVAGISELFSSRINYKLWRERKRVISIRGQG